MIPKRLEEITEGDLVALIENQVREGRTIEYKRELPAISETGKGKFLAGASSFANTSGGDILFGIDELKGLPTQIVGIQSSVLDREILRLEQTMDSGLEPRIRRNFQAVNCGDGKRVVVLRIDRSWSGPHRVSFQESGKFWGRNSAGKYPLDVSELRSAFTLSSTVMERIRGFRTDRIIAISNNETPIPLKLGPKIVLHCIPVESFASQNQFDVISLYRKNCALPIMGPVGWSPRLNLDGLLTSDYFDGHSCGTYTHLYRNGLIEMVSGNNLVFDYNGRQVISFRNYEEQLLEYLPKCFVVLQQIGTNVPIVVALTLTNVRGLRMYDPNPFAMDRFPIYRDTLVLPESTVQEFSDSLTNLLIPMFNFVWNACGYPKSMNFDDEGNWTGRS
jgi:hypothetical protein